MINIEPLMKDTVESFFKVKVSEFYKTQGIYVAEVKDYYFCIRYEVSRFGVVVKAIKKDTDKVLNIFVDMIDAKKY